MPDNEWPDPRLPDRMEWSQPHHEPPPSRGRTLLAAAVVALQISQTIAEEEVIRDAHISAPTRVRRFLSRFMVVIVVAVAVEGLVATFKARENPSLMLYAAAILCSVGVILAGWGLFVRLNRYAEELEPEAMAEAKREDRRLDRLDRAAAKASAGDPTTNEDTAVNR